jgi:hypothetical protein
MYVDVHRAAATSYKEEFFQFVLTIITLYKCVLKGHGNEADFPRFVHKSFWHWSLTLHFEPFRFLLRIRGDIRNRKTTRRLGESGSCRFSDSSIMNIFANSKPKSERLERKCKGCMRIQFMQKPQKIRLITMSL